MKIKNIVIVALLLAPIMVLATSGHHVDPESTKYFKLTGRVDDFWQRVINFSIFAALLYYLAANPIKAFFKGRREGIAKRFKDIEEKLNASKDAAKKAEENLVANQAKAEELKKDSVVEGAILAENIAKKNAETLESMEKQSAEKMEHESKKMTKNVINKLLADGITNDDIAVDESKVVSLVSKKVA